jgi:hypothetical protein
LLDGDAFGTEIERRTFDVPRGDDVDRHVAERVDEQVELPDQRGLALVAPNEQQPVAQAQGRQGDSVESGDGRRVSDRRDAASRSRPIRDANALSRLRRRSVACVVVSLLGTLLGGVLAVGAANYDADPTQWSVFPMADGVPCLR